MIPQNTENLYRILFESATEGLLVVNDLGEICVINPRVTELFGFEELELIGQKIEVLLPKRYHGHHVGLRDSYSNKPSKRKMGAGRDLTGQHKDGHEVPLEISLNHIMVEDQLFIIALLTDISERKIAEARIQKLNQELEEKVEERTAELHASQRLYALISRNYPEGTINVFDRDLNYVFVEGKELYRMGIDSTKLVGTNYLKRLKDPSIVDRIQLELESVFDGVDNTFEVEYSDQIYAMHAVPLPKEDGEITQILVVERNITKEKNAEREIRKALEKEKELNELKSRFVAMASHEFRTPLSTILSSTSLISHYDDPKHLEKRHKHINRIRSSVTHLNTILNDILSLSRLEEGRIEVKKASFDIVEFKQEICEEIGTIAKKGQTCDQTHSGETSITHDKVVLRQILYNLLSNAIKYSPEHSKVVFSTKVENEQLTIAITDYGHGIPLADQHRMFERFFRAGNVTNIQGTGLGLNIVKRQTEMLGGEISFESIPEERTTFTVQLPQHLTS